MRVSLLSTLSPPVVHCWTPPPSPLPPSVRQTAVGCSLHPRFNLNPQSLRLLPNMLFRIFLPPSEPSQISAVSSCGQNIQKVHQKIRDISERSQLVCSVELIVGVVLEFDSNCTIQQRRNIRAELISSLVPGCSEFTSA